MSLADTLEEFRPNAPNVSLEPVLVIKGGGWYLGFALGAGRVDRVHSEYIMSRNSAMFYFSLHRSQICHRVGFQHRRCRFKLHLDVSGSHDRIGIDSCSSKKREAITRGTACRIEPLPAACVLNPALLRLVLLELSRVRNTSDATICGIGVRTL